MMIWLEGKAYLLCFRRKQEFGFGINNENGKSSSTKKRAGADQHLSGLQPVKKCYLWEISSGRFCKRFFYNKGLPKFSVQVICYISLYKHILDLPKCSVKSALLTTFVWKVSEKEKGCYFTSASEKRGERSKAQNEGAQEMRSRGAHMIVGRPLCFPWI